MSKRYEIVLEASTWALDDEVIQLRARGSERAFLLPAPASAADRSAPRGSKGPQHEAWLVGTGDDCEVQLGEVSGGAVESHALLMRHQARWVAVAVGASPTLLVDGIAQPAALLVPGTELTIGDTTLVAESLAFVDLRQFIRLLVGAQGTEVDDALFQLRQAQTLHSPLILRCEEPLLPIARELHRRIYGTARPFVVYSAHRPAFVDCAAALAAAAGGTLCLFTSSLPPDWVQLCDRCGVSSASETQVVLCDDARLLSEEEHDLIRIPSVQSRPDELLGLILELGGEAMRELEVAPPFAMEDVLAVLRYDASSFMEILEATRRFAALRKTGSLVAAADLLQMPPEALQRWMGRREIRWLASAAACNAN